tara:strand:- start:509 stop:1288 length:780 start_codon:yes stop_codon:yes gene_type:complete
MHALMVGCGNMGASLLARWVDVPGMTYAAVDPVATFPDSRVKTFKSAADVQGGPYDLLVIAVKPQMIADVIPDYLKYVRPDAPALSIAAGVACERLETVVGSRPIIRVMPNLPASIGKGVSGVYFNDKTPDDAKTLARQMMQAAGSVVEVDKEDDLDKVTAIAGSGPGYVFEIARTYMEAAKELGFEESQARKLVLDTIAGTIELAASSSDDLADMRNAVTSKAGTTEAGLKALNGNGDLSRLLLEATQAAYKRAVELR